MIIGTAGHIDHGKTALVRALTGVDADRLPEEKARGITIDIGFAYQAISSAESLGFVDVPGHERFVHNMLAGAIGIDYVLLVVAADDGPMPQTREHLQILDLLELRRGIVALSKADLVPPERLGEVFGQMRALLSETGLADADILPVSSVTGVAEATSATPCPWKNSRPPLPTTPRARPTAGRRLRSASIRARRSVSSIRVRSRADGARRGRDVVTAIVPPPGVRWARAPSSWNAPPRPGPGAAPCP